MKRIEIGDRWVGEDMPVYIIAEIASNFDGSIDRARMLINLAHDCGADAVKFQSFIASRIISKRDFEELKVGFQAKWKRSVYEMYESRQLPREWHGELLHCADMRGLHFLATPYDMEAVDLLDKLDVPAFKVGSGDITWHDMLQYIARKGKPIILSTGASTIEEISEAVGVIRSTGNEEIILLQCVTNYPSHFESANIRTMEAMGKRFDILIGYSDHTSGAIVPLGAVALGACIIEKHLTDDRTRDGPDHPFSMTGEEFKEMVDKIRILEKALGSPVKSICEEEKETVILQRRCLRAQRFIVGGSELKDEMISVLRPAPLGAMEPKQKKIILGRRTRRNIEKGEPLMEELLC